MTNKSHPPWQNPQQLLIHPARNRHAVEGAVDGDGAVQRSALAFGDEGGPGLGLRRDEVGEGGEGVPFFAGGGAVWGKRGG